MPLGPHVLERRGKRIFARVPLTLLLESHGKKRAHRAFTVDFSELGARVRAGSILSPGQLVEVIPDEAPHYAVRGRVVWVRAAGSERYGLAGLEFLNSLLVPERTKEKGWTSVGQELVRTAPWGGIRLSLRTPGIPAGFGVLPPTGRTLNERKQTRVNIQMPAYIRGGGLGDEVVVTENISRGGLSFKSHHRYSPASLIQVAVPYSRRANNIFVLVRTVYSLELPAEKMALHGVAYVKAEKG